jgi:hypothetical protein
MAVFALIVVPPLMLSYALSAISGPWCPNNIIPTCLQTPVLVPAAALARGHPSPPTAEPAAYEVAARMNLEDQRLQASRADDCDFGVDVSGDGVVTASVR